MNEERFWRIIADCNLSVFDTDEWNSLLITALRRLEPDEIIQWNHAFDRFAAAAYSIDLMAACCMINLGAGDDGFYYFRCWLIGMGQRAYEAAIRNPDTLAEVVNPRHDAEAEIYGAAHQAWMIVTGQPDTADYPARNEAAELQGDNWDFENRRLQQEHFPRLSKLYSPHAESRPCTS